MIMYNQSLLLYFLSHLIILNAITINGHLLLNLLSMNNLALNYSLYFINLAISNNNQNLLVGFNINLIYHISKSNLIYFG